MVPRSKALVNPRCEEKPIVLLEPELVVPACCVKPSMFDDMVLDDIELVVPAEVESELLVMLLTVSE